MGIAVAGCLKQKITNLNNLKFFTNNSSTLNTSMIKEIVPTKDPSRNQDTMNYPLNEGTSNAFSTHDELVCFEN